MKGLILKVCFVLDCTESMTEWIDAAKNKILDLLKDLCKSNKNYTINTALIGYRDFGEENYTVNFTTNHYKIHDTILGIKVSGGDDTAEDISGAYDWVNRLDWNNADVKAIFHITDAPNHGRIYHEEYIDDDYPNGHPTIDLRKEIKTISSNEIDLTIFRLNNSTDIMYKILQDTYLKIRPKGFRIVDFTKSTQSADDTLYEVVKSQLMISMNTIDSTY